MRSFLQREIFNNTVQDYLVCIAAILLIVVVKRYLSRYIAAIFFGALYKTSWKIRREAFIVLLKGPIHMLLILSITFLALDRLKYPSFLEFKVHHISSRQIMDSAFNAVLIIAFIWLLLRLIDFIAMILEQNASLTPGFSDAQLVVFFKDFFKVIIICIGILLVIRFTFYKNIATLLAGLGIVGAALALSARESLENLIASFIIFFDKPFSSGDLVKVQSFTGTVERIGLRSTRIRTDQKTYVTVPNKQMVDSILDNLTLRTQRRGFLSLEISASTAYNLVRGLIEDIERLLSEKKERVQSFSVVLSDISKNSFIVQVEYFTGPVGMEVFNKVRQEINLAIIQMIEERSIKLAGKETELIVNTGG